MAHQPLSGATLDEFAIEFSPRRVSDSVYSIKRNHHTTNNAHPNTCCGGGGYHGCGCGCKGCVCRLTHFKDESNSEVYGSEGGQGMPRPDVDLPDRAPRYDSSSSYVRTTESVSNGSFDNSFEARGHLDGHHIASANINGVGHQFAATEEEEDGHDAWRLFVSPANSLDHLSLEEDSSGMLIPGLMDDSTLAAHGSDVDIDERSILSSDYESSFVQPSATTSEVLPGIGATFQHHFLVRPLRLTPECRHNINTPICARCAH